MSLLKAYDYGFNPKRKSYSEMSEMLWLSPNTISAIKKA